MVRRRRRERLRTWQSSRSTADFSTTSKRLATTSDSRPSVSPSARMPHGEVVHAPCVRKPVLSINRRQLQVFDDSDRDEGVGCRRSRRRRRRGGATRVVRWVVPRAVHPARAASPTRGDRWSAPAARCVPPSDGALARRFGRDDVGHARRAGRVVPPPHECRSACVVAKRIGVA